MRTSALIAVVALGLVALVAANPPSCNECWGKTTGPCRHNMDYSCFGYFEGTTTCPPGSTECGPIDCQVNAWSAWGKCDEECGGGFQTRTRAVTTIPSDGGALCPVLTETQACNEHKCAEDICQVSEWSAWGKCSATCGGGSQTRSRTVVSGFLHCPDLEESQDCNTHACTDCAGCAAKTSGPCMHDNDNTCFSYFPGTKACPPGTTACVVKKNNLGLLGGAPGNGMCTDCFGKSAGPCRHDKAPVCHEFIAGTTTCPAGTTACAPVNCEVSAWSAWNKCSVSCGGGSQTRTRSVTVQPANGGMACPALSEDQACNEQACLPVCENCNGKSAGPCQHDNDDSCFNYMSGTTTCPPGSHECVVQDCVVSEWGAWGKCDAMCDGGVQFRDRTVVIPASKGGASCPHLQENQACNTHKCASCAGCMGKSGGPCMHNLVPVCFDYYYGTEDCPAGSTKCAVSGKSFGALNTLPGTGMCSNCFGKSAGPCRHNADSSCHNFVVGTKSCPVGTTLCGPIDCEVSAWSAWNKCSASCGGGSQSRTRTVTVNPANGGTACPDLEEVQACNEDPCMPKCSECTFGTYGPCQHDNDNTCMSYFPKDGLNACPPGTHECVVVDCEVSAWTAWNKCSAGCGGGSQSRSRTVLVSPSPGGIQCPDLTEDQACNEHACIDCVGCAGKSSGPCMHDKANVCYGYYDGTENCPAGTTKCAVTGKSFGLLGDAAGAAGDGMCTGCFGKSVGPCRHLKDTSCYAYTAGTKTCPPGTAPCAPVNCEVSAWSAWNKCSVTCGGGSQTRTRSVTVQPSNGGMACPALSEDQNCNTHKCPVLCDHCGGKSSGPCVHDADGTCHEYNTGTTTCPAGTTECENVDCEVTQWGDWSDCSVTCGGGSRSRSRKILTQPSKFGQQCPVLSESEGCNSHSCSGCAGCLGKSSGPCMHNKVAVCYDYYAGTTTCPAGSTACAVSGNSFGVLGGAPGTGMCTGCFGKSTGPCRHVKDSSCHGYFPGTQTCPPGTAPCAPVNCEVSAWSAWNKCSAACGGGTQSRTRSVTVAPANGGMACPALSEDQSCNTHKCAPACTACYKKSTGPCRHDNDGSCFQFIAGTTTCPAGTTQCEDRDCVVSAWSAWTKCSVNCGGGLQTRSRSVVTPQAGNGAACPVLSESQACNEHACHDCSGCWGKTSGPCQHDKDNSCTSYFAGTESCPPGTTACVVKKNNLGLLGGAPGNGMCTGCFGKSAGPCRHVKDTSCYQFMWGTQTCPPGTAPCAPVNCEVSAWSAWGKCSVSCGGGGQRTRTRTITVQPSNGGMACPDLEEVDVHCNEQPCPTVCTDCVGGTSGNCRHNKDGTCFAFFTKGGLNECVPGTTLCYPVDCEVSAWGAWGKCSAACGGGSQTRARSITVAPKDGGAACPALTESQSCNDHACSGCAGCASKTAGPCMHNKANVCYDYYAGTSDCPAGTTDCATTGNTLGLLGGVPGDGLCKGCFGKTAGPCRHDKDTSCFAFLAGTSDCPAGTHQCMPVNCEVSAWSAFGACSEECGGGEYTRTRTITVQPSNGGMKCPSLTDTQACNEQACLPICHACAGKSAGPCQHLKDTSCHHYIAGTTTCPAGTTECSVPIDCVVSQWGAWDACSAKCEGGSQSRSRTVLVASANGGQACPALSESQACNEQPCATCSGCAGKSGGPCKQVNNNVCHEYYVGTKICPAGTVSCVNKNLNLGAVGVLGGAAGNGMCSGCFGKSAGPCRHVKDTSCYNYMYGTQTCPPGTAPCAPVDCVVSAWSAWAKCSAECGGGSQGRFRSVVVAPSNGGAACPHLDESQDCNMHKCPVRCDTCGGKSSGPCRHDKDGTCHAFNAGTTVCPAGTTVCEEVDCVVSEWGAWGKCDVTCGGGVQQRERTVTTNPTNGGKACPALTDSQACNSHKCSGCAGCLGKSSGPCMHDKVAVCYGYYHGTTICPAGTTKCAVAGKSFGLLGGAPGNGMCSGCAGKSSGPCKNGDNDVCYNFFAGSTTCPPGTSACSPTNCEVSAWSAWSKCSASCGGGSQTRARSITVQPSNGGMVCPPLSDSQACNTHKCGAPKADAPLCGSCAGKSAGPCRHTKDNVCHDYYYGTSICPAGTVACVLCDTCVGKTSGPCQHDKDGSCFAYQVGTTCPAGTHDCSAADNGNGNNAAVCTGCWPGTAGPCQGKNTVCYDYFPGTSTCPGGTYECSKSGSFAAKPLVVFDIEVDGDDFDGADFENQMVDAAGLDAGSVVVEVVTQGVGSATVGFVVVSDDPFAAAGRVSSALETGQVSAGFVGMNKPAEVSVSQAGAASAGTAMSTTAIALIAVAGVAIIAVVVGVIVASRKGAAPRFARHSSSKVMNISIPSQKVRPVSPAGERVDCDSTDSDNE